MLTNIKTNKYIQRQFKSNLTKKLPSIDQNFYCNYKKSQYKHEERKKIMFIDLIIKKMAEKFHVCKLLKIHRLQ